MGNTKDLSVKSENPMSVEDIAKALAANLHDVGESSLDYSTGESGAEVSGETHRCISYSAHCSVKDAGGTELFKVSAAYGYKGSVVSTDKRGIKKLKQKVEEFKEHRYLFQNFKVTPYMDYVLMETAVDSVNTQLG